jgi:hypothetical protein
MPVKRQRSNRTETLECRLQTEAVNLRKQAEGMPAGVRRDERLQKACEAEAAVHINRWLASPSRQA